MNSDFSFWQEIITGVAQGSVLVALFFNISVSDLFSFVSSFKLSNCADDNTLNTFGYNLQEVKEVLLNDLN